MVHPEKPGSVRLLITMDGSILPVGMDQFMSIKKKQNPMYFCTKSLNCRPGRFQWVCQIFIRSVERKHFGSKVLSLIETVGTLLEQTCVAQESLESACLDSTL